MLLVVTVRDTGIGIRKEDMDKLFTQFARFDMEKNRNIEGTGLGLALARRLTDLMHGTLELQSVYGVGTSAAFTVPQQVVDSQPVGDFQQNYMSSADKVEAYHQSFEAPDARILVVDDVAVNLKVIVNLLKSTKITVDTAAAMQRLEHSLNRNTPLFWRSTGWRSAPSKKLSIWAPDSFCSTLHWGGRGSQPHCPAKASSKAGILTNRQVSAAKPAGFVA